MDQPSDTIAALGTPAGTAALAVVRISGPDTSRLAWEFFGGAPPPRAARVGRYRDPSGAVLDQAVFTYYAGPQSYTGEDLLEISCHGNPYLVHRILEDLHARGCRPAEPGEFTRRAFLNGRMDLSQAEAVMDVIHARSERALQAAQRLLDGALGRLLKPLTDGLVDALARVEAYIDFPEEDLPPEDLAEVRRIVGEVAAGASRLLATQRYGRLLRDGIRTVIVGEPNAGKSSLLNCLVGRDRAIVSPEPGTTRDYLEERVIAGPHCLRLVDTAGLNPAPGPVERLGIDRTREQVAEADLILLVLDATRPTPPLEPELLGRLKPGTALAVLNKKDLLHGPAAAVPPEGIEAVAVSALTGSGINELSEAVGRLAEGLKPGLGEDAVAINARHAHALSQAGDCLGQALGKLDAGSPTELLASDLRGALSALGEIAGRIDNERVLDRLFAEFCIGK
jgi:tRNA modification GTPase